MSFRIGRATSNNFEMGLCTTKIKCMSQFMEITSFNKVIFRSAKSTMTSKRVCVTVSSIGIFMEREDLTAYICD